MSKKVGDNPSFCHELLFVFYKAPSLTRAPESPTFSRPIDAEKSKSTSKPAKRADWGRCWIIVKPQGPLRSQVAWEVELRYLSLKVQCCLELLTLAIAQLFLWFQNSISSFHSAPILQKSKVSGETQFSWGGKAWSGFSKGITELIGNGGKVSFEEVVKVLVKVGAKSCYLTQLYNQ
jgi:hypothetical protein